MNARCYVLPLLIAASSASAENVSAVKINLAHLSPDCIGGMGGDHTFQIKCPSPHPGYKLETSLSPQASVPVGDDVNSVSLWVSKESFSCNDLDSEHSAQRLTSDMPIVNQDAGGVTLWHFCVESKQPIPEIQVDILPIAEPNIDGMRIFDVNFEHNSSELSVATQQSILTFLKYSGDITDYRVELHAHASEVGNESSNQALSEKRASVVRAFLLIKSNLTLQDIAVGSFGESRPAHLTPNPEHDPRIGWDRRVNIVLIRK